MKHSFKFFKTLAKITIYIYVLALCIPAFIFLAIQTPFIQDAITQKLSQYLSEKLKTQINFKQIHISTNFQIHINNFIIRDKEGTTLIAAKKIKIQPDIRTILTDKIVLRNIYFDTPEVNLKMEPHKNELNIQFLVDFFSSKDATTTDKDPAKLVIKHLYIHNGKFSYIEESNEHSKNKTIDFSNLVLNKIDFNATQIEIAKDIKAQIRNIHFVEKSGFHLKHFQGSLVLNDTMINLDNALILTNFSKIKGQIGLFFRSFGCFQNFMQNVNFKVLLSESKIHSEDLFFFYSDIPSFGIIDVSGNFIGPLSQLRIQNCSMKVIQNTTIALNALLVGLPDLKNTFFEINVQELYIPIYDMFIISKTFSLPSNLKEYTSNLLYFKLKGNAIGFIHDFSTKSNIQSNTGFLEADINVKIQENTIAYKGAIKTENLILGLILKMPQLGALTANLNLEGKNFDLNSLTLNATGNIESFAINNNVLKNISLDISMINKLLTGSVIINDPNLSSIFQGSIDFSYNLPLYDFTSKIQNINLYELKIFDQYPETKLSANIYFRGQGSNLDDFIGELTLGNLNYQQGNESFTLEKLMLHKYSHQDNTKTLKISSDLLDLSIDGNIQLSSSFDYIKAFIAEYFYLYSDSLISVTESYAQIKFNIKNFKPITKLFIPSLELSPNSTIECRFDKKRTNEIFLKILADTIIIDNNHFINNIINLETFNKTIYGTLHSQLLQTPFGSFENIIFSSVIKQNFANFSLYWNNYDSINALNGYISGNVKLDNKNEITVALLPSEFTIDNIIWNIPEGLIKSTPESLLIDKLKIYNEKQVISVKGINSITQPSETITITIQNFQTNNFSKFLAKIGLPQIDSEINGTLAFENIFLKPIIRGNFNTGNFRIENKSWGALVASFNIDAKDLKGSTFISTKLFRDTLQFQPIIISGNFEVGQIPYFDLICNLSRFDMRLLEPFVQNYIRINSGSVSGKIHLKGNIQNLSTYGMIQMVRANIFVNYLNTSFLITDSILISNNLIYNPALSITDAKGKKAIAQIFIQHDNFTKPRFNIKLQTTDDFLVMNTTAANNDLFYGRAFLNGNINITGTDKEMNLLISGVTGSGTEFYLPLYTGSTITENNFITFKTPQKTEQATNSNNSYNEVTPEINYNIQFDLDVTPDAQIQIIFDPTIGDILKARTTGNIKIDITPDNFSMFGSIKVEEGDYLFTLENIVNKKFIIQKGSSITWQGDPYNSTIDVTALYSARARLYDLIKHIDSSDVYKSKIPIDVALNLKNNLITPDISFNIYLPQANENVTNLLKTAINSDQELNRQVFALLVMNSFLPPETSFQQQTSLGLGTTSMEFISNQFSNWLSQISKDIDVGLNYRTAHGDQSSELELALTTHLLHDRIRLEGNLGMAGNQSINQQNTLLSNFQLEYKLTSDGNIRLKGFNRNNPFDALTKNSPYTQGVGIFVRKEFDRFSEIWRRDEEKIRKRKRLSRSHKEIF